ncbi:MAG: chromosome segregation SMC family protein [Nitrososphaerota archaeon]
MVYIKKLTIQGFKSFGSKKNSIDFEKGLVVITGPNGGGKSNILDAIRFALGELSAHNLRVGKMSELVYDDASTSIAKVSLTLDNSERILPVDSPEVTITRRLDRNGESEYLLNGRQASRAEILTILSMANIKPTSFNIVPQGSVTSIAEMSNIELRKMLEDISGIGEYDKKKQEAEEHLQIAEKNIAIAKAGTTEVKSRVNQLQRERNEAYRRRQIEDILSAIRLAKLRSTESTLKKELIELDAELMKLEEEITKIQDSREQYARELSAAEEEWTRYTREISELEEKMRGAEKIREELRLREISLTSEKSTTIERLRNIDIELTNLKTSLEESSNLKENIIQTIAKEKTKHDSIKEDFSNIVGILEERKKKLDLLKIQLNNLERDLEEAVSRKNRLEKDIELTKVRIAEVEKKITSIEEESTKILNIITEGIQEITKMQHSYRKRVDELQKLEETLEHLNREYVRLRNKLLKAQEIEKNLSRIIQTIGSMGLIGKRSLEEKVKDALGEVKEVYGILRDWVDVEDYRMLIRLEAGTSGWIHSLVVGNWMTGIQLAEIFHKSGLKIKILPLEMVKKGNNLKFKGIKPKAKWAEEVLSHLLKNVSFKNVVELPRNPNTVIVDSRGIVSYPDGRIEVSSTVFDQNIIQLEHEYNESIKILNQVRARIEEIQNLLYTTELEKNRTYDEKGKINLEKELEERALKKLREEIFENFIKFAHLHVERIKLKKELLNDKLMLEEHVKNLERLKQIDGSEIQLLKEDIKKNEEEFLNLSAKRKELELELRESSRLIQEYNREFQRLEAQIEKTKLKIEEKKKEKEELEKMLEHILTQHNTVQAEHEKHNQELNNLIMGIQQRKNEIEKHSSRISNMRSELRLLDSRLQELTNKRLSIAVRRSQQETELKKIREELDSLPVLDSPEIPVEMAGELENELIEELRELDKINQLAPQQYEELIGNYKLRSQRIRELEEERDEIFRFINWIESEKRKVFMNTFNKVSESFERFFSILTGGQAWLKLEDFDNPFSKGVEMILRFPGKSARSARSASGGEKSVAAVALLLALQGLTPAEFYVFDEVDAHMDINYSTRLAELFEEMSRKTQIIVISLKDVIAEKAEQLIGVYNRGGESRIVKMNVNEVVGYE